MCIKRDRQGLCADIECVANIDLVLHHLLYLTVLFACMSEHYIMLVRACTARVSACMPACVPEAGLEGCLHLSVEQFNFVVR